MTHNMSAVLDQFRAAIRGRCLIPGEIVADGKLQRCPVEGGKAGRKDGRYLLHMNGIPAGGFQNHRDGHGWEKWRADTSESFASEQRAAYRTEMEAVQTARKEQQETKRAACRAKTVVMWNAAHQPSPDHAYLVHKKVMAHGLRQLREALLVPVRDVNGVMHGLELIKPDGDKKFLGGTEKSGHYHPIGKLADNHIMAIAEGYSTAATIHEATDWPVAVAFDCGNLKSVAQALRAKYPQAVMVICADNDHGSANNPGLRHGKLAAIEVEGYVAYPEFSDGVSGTDWNDYAAIHGLSRTAIALRFCLSRSTPRAAAAG